MNAKLFLLSIFSAATLAACGGGGDSAPAVAAQPEAPAGQAAAATTAASKYTGTWKSACFKNTSDVRTDPFNATTLAYQKRSYTFAATSSSSASVVWTDTYYLDTDTTCAGAAEFEVIRPNTNTVTIDGTGTGLTGPLTSQTVDQVTLVVARPFTGRLIPGGTYQLFNSMWIPSSYDQAATIKQIALVTATTLTFGNRGAPLVNDYPTTLGTALSFIYTKQP